MRVLGVDPGSLATGWGVLTGPAARPRLAACGVIRLGRSDGLPERLAQLRGELDRVLSRERPTCAAVESPFHGASARAALQLAHARGVVLAALAEAGLDVAEYSPATVKQAVTGNGRADKQQVRTMVGRLLRAHVGGRPADLTDALAVAWCHVAHAGFDSRVRAAAARVTRPRR